MPQGCLQFVLVVFPDHTHLLFSIGIGFHFVFNFLVIIKQRGSIQGIYSVR